MTEREGGEEIDEGKQTERERGQILRTVLFSQVNPKGADVFYISFSRG